MSDAELDDLPDEDVSRAAASYGLDVERYQWLVDRDRVDVLDLYNQVRAVQAKLDAGPELYAARRELFLRLLGAGEQQVTIARAIGVTAMVIHQHTGPREYRRSKTTKKS